MCRECEKDQPLSFDENQLNTWLFGLGSIGSSNGTIFSFKAQAYYMVSSVTSFSKTKYCDTCMRVWWTPEQKEHILECRLQNHDIEK